MVPADDGTDAAVRPRHRWRWVATAAVAAAVLIGAASTLAAADPPKAVVDRDLEGASAGVMFERPVGRVVAGACDRQSLVDRIRADGDLGEAHRLVSGVEVPDLPVFIDELFDYVVLQEVSIGELIVDSGRVRQDIVMLSRGDVLLIDTRGRPTVSCTTGRPLRALPGSDLGPGDVPFDVEAARRALDAAAVTPPTSEPVTPTRPSPAVEPAEAAPSGADSADAGLEQLVPFAPEPPPPASTTPAPTSSAPEAPTVRRSPTTAPAVAPTTAPVAAPTTAPAVAPTTAPVAQPTPAPPQTPATTGPPITAAPTTVAPAEPTVAAPGAPTTAAVAEP